MPNSKLKDWNGLVTYWPPLFYCSKSKQAAVESLSAQLGLAAIILLVHTIVSVEKS